MIDLVETPRREEALAASEGNQIKARAFQGIVGKVIGVASKVRTLFIDPAAPARRSTGSSPALWRKLNSRAGPATINCVRRRSRACAKTRSPSAITIERPAPQNGKSALARKASAPAASSALARASDIKLTNPDKILWPKTDITRAITKQDLADYMAAVAGRMMPHIKGRPCSILRTPDGIGGMTFFQRHADKGASNLITQVKFGDDKKPYIQFDRPEALIAAAQSGATELHPWNCQPFDLETPGRLVFDLDPAPDLEFDAVIAAAKEMKQRLEALGLTTFCKTTGGKGLHVVTPLAKPRGGGALRWPEAKAFAREVCAQMAADSPDLYLIRMSKKEREGRIFLDYLRNDQTATAVAPYSPRARPGATVSIPLKWNQVRKGLDPKVFNILTVPSLIAKPDPWTDYAKSGGSFAAAAKKLGRC